MLLERVRIAFQTICTVASEFTVRSDCTSLVHRDRTVSDRPMTFGDTVVVIFNFRLVFVKKSVTPVHARMLAYEHDLDDRERRRARILNAMTVMVSVASALGK